MKLISRRTSLGGVELLPISDAISIISDSNTSHLNEYRNQSGLGFHIRIASRFYMNVSLDKVARHTLFALAAKGYDVSAEPKDSHIDDTSALLDVRRFITVEPTEPYVKIDFCADDPQSWVKCKPGNILIHYLPYDSYTSKYKDNIPIINNIPNFILVPNESCKQLFVEDGVIPDKILVAKHGIDLSTYYSDGPTISYINGFPGAKRILWSKNPLTGNEFSFLSMGLLQARKGIPDLVKTFCKTFDNSTSHVLIIKGRVWNWGHDISADIADILDQYPNHPPIMWIDGVISEEDNAKLLRSVDCVVSAHKFEGFGLVPLEAMACGTPVICTDYSGPSEYLTDANSYKIPCVEVKGVDDFHADVGKWARYKSADLAKLLRQVTDSESANAKSQQALIDVRKWSTEHAAEDLLRAINDVNIPLAKIKRQERIKGLVSICVPVRNGVEDIKLLIESWKTIDHGTKTELIIVDDGSTDTTYSSVKKILGRTKNIKIIRNEIPKGCPYSRNVAFSVAKGEYIFSCDCDIRFCSNNWLKTLIESLNKIDNCGIIAPMLIENGMTSAGGTFGVDGFPNRHRNLYKCSLQSTKVVYAPGAAWLFKADLIDLVGYMWEEYFPTIYDDVDFCFQVRRAGLDIWTAPEVNIIHNDGSYTSTDNTNNQRNKNLFEKYWLTRRPSDPPIFIHV